MFSDLEGLLDVMIPSLLTFRRSQWQAAVDDYNRIALNPAALKVYQSEQAVAVERITSIMQVRDYFEQQISRV